MCPTWTQKSAAPSGNDTEGGYEGRSLSGRSALLSYQMIGGIASGLQKMPGRNPRRQ